MTPKIQGGMCGTYYVIPRLGYRLHKIEITRSNDRSIWYQSDEGEARIYRGHVTVCASYEEGKQALIDKCIQRCKEHMAWLEESQRVLGEAINMVEAVEARRIHITKGKNEPRIPSACGQC